MAQKLKAVDLGSWSLKVVTLNRTLVGTGVASVEERPMASRADGKGRDREAWKLLREVLGDRRLVGDAITVSFPGERVLNRRLEVPFTDRSKVDQILPFELEQHVPYAADAIVADYILRKAAGSGAELLAAVVPRAAAEELHTELQAARLDPRVVGHPLVAMARLETLIRGTGSLEPMLLVDMGHTKTLAVLVLNGNILGLRSILRGGMALTRRVAQGLGVEFDEAERIKHGAHLFPAGQGSEGEGRTHEVAAMLREELLPVVRDLVLLLRSVAADARVRIHLFGGGARLQGLPEFLDAELGHPVEVLSAGQLRVAVPDALDDPGMVPALAAGLDSVRGGDGERINLRRLAFPYAGDFRNLRGRLAYLGIMSFLMISAFLTPSFLKFRAMNEMNEALRDEILSLSEEILGEPVEDVEDVMAAFEGMPGPGAWTVYPDLTALETFYEVEAVIATVDGLPAEPGEEGVAPEAAAEMSPEEQALAEIEGELPSPGEADAAPEAPAAPAGPQVHGLKTNRIIVDMTNETKGIGGVVEYNGDCSSVATLELFETALQKHPCFHNVVRSDQQVVGADAERKGWQRFSLNFNVACPKADRKSDKDTPPGIGPEAVPASSAGPAPGTPPPSPGRPAAPPVKEPTSSPVPPPEAAVPAPEGEALPDPGAPEGAPAAEAPGLPEGPEARIPAMERPTRIRAAGPPHVGGPGATVPARVPSSRALERPAGADTTRRIPGIRPGN